MNRTHKLASRLATVEHLIAALCLREGVDRNLLQEWLCASQDVAESAEHAGALGREVFQALKDKADEGLGASRFGALAEAERRAQ